LYVKWFYLRKYRKYDALILVARQSEISSWLPVKSTRASCFLLKWGMWGGVIPGILEQIC